MKSSHRLDATRRFAFLADWNIVATLWNQPLHRNRPLFKKWNLALIGGARAANAKADRFATARTRTRVLPKVEITKPAPCTLVRLQAHGGRAVLQRPPRAIAVN